MFQHAQIQQIIEQPYPTVKDLSVRGSENPNLMPESSITVRFHSVGGWGAITTGKNLGEIIGEFGDYIAKRDNATDEFGEVKEVLHVSANPKYGSEKKGAPTAYFLVVAPERVRVNCDLQHIDKTNNEIKIIGDGACPPSLAGTTVPALTAVAEPLGVSMHRERVDSGAYFLEMVRQAAVLTGR